MRNWILILFVLVSSGILISSCKSMKITEETAGNVLDTFVQAINDGNMEVLNTLWSAGETVRVFEQGSVDSSWAHYRDHHLARELEVIQDLSYRHSGEEIHMGTDMALATGRYHLEGVYKEKPIKSDGVYSIGLTESASGSWKIVHLHYSRRPK